MMLTRVIVGRAKSVITLMLCGVLASMPVAAQRFTLVGMEPVHPQQLILARAGGESLDSAVARVRRQTGGRVLSAETRNEDGTQVHYIRVITRDGKVRNIRIVAQPR